RLSSRHRSSANACCLSRCHSDEGLLTPSMSGSRPPFREKWGQWYGGYVDRNDLPPHLTLHVAAMDFPGAYDLLRRAIADRSVARVLEFREYGEGYKMETAAADFMYN